MTPFAWALLAALCWGIAPWFEKTGLQGGSDPSVGVLVRSLGILGGAVCMLPFLPQAWLRLVELPARKWFFLAAGGFMASIVGQLFFYRALKIGELSRVVPLGASYPLVACLLGLLFWKEPLTVAKAWGIVFVMAGVYLLH